MSTRSGEFVTLKEVVDEVGKDACRFFFLLRAPDSQLEFDLELAKKHSSDNPVFYVQYVNARCNSIIRESKKQNGFAAGSRLFFAEHGRRKGTYQTACRFLRYFAALRKNYESSSLYGLSD